MPFTIGSMAEQQWNFTTSQWLGLIATGEAAAAVSFVSNGCVLILHAFMTWYRPAVVNRLSLRMIVVSVVFNMVYCACQLVTDDISNQSSACRAIAYVMIAADTMACMCLAMVGLNLVMIFVLKVSRSVKIEIIYYLIVAASGVIVCLVPFYVGTPKGPRNKREEASCWYHYYFNGRINNIFNWMWYYAWLLFSSVFAALCAAISIRFVVKKQENFNGALDMFTKRNQKDLHTMAIIKRYAVDNTDVFQKIARRCICYPIVPLISKSWGIGIEIAATQKVSVPYPIYVIDRAFSCLLGFMISCIYFTDPAIRAVVKESIHKLKQRYVYDYFSIKYEPGTDPSVQAASHYPKILKIVPVTDDIDRTPEYVQEVRNRYFSQDLEIQGGGGTERSMLDPLDHHTIDPTQFQSRPPSHKPDVPTITIQTAHHASDWENSPQERRYSVLNATSIHGHTYTPNEAVAAAADTKRRPSAARAKTIPMHRVDNTVDVGVNMSRKNHHYSPHQHRYLKHTERVETLVPYKFPVMARMVHWLLIHVFRVKAEPPHRHDSDDDDSDDDDSDNGDFFARPGRRPDGPSRTFRDYTDGSDPESPKLMRRNDSISFHPDVELKSAASLLYSQQRDVGSTSSVQFPPEGSTTATITTTGRMARKRSMPEIFFLRRGSDSRYARGLKEGGTSPEFPLRRVSSINVATLQRNRVNKKPVKSASIQTSPPLESRDSAPSSNKPSIGLSKMLNRGRSMSFSWTRLTNAKGKYALPGSPLNLEQPLSQTDSASNPSGQNVPSSSDAASSGHTRSKTISDVVHPADHISMMDMQVGHHSINIPAEPELSYYPKELSPRPRSQYKKPPTISKSLLQERRESAATVAAGMSKAANRLSKRKQQNRRSSVISDREQSFYLHELFYGYQQVLDLEDLTLKHNSMQSELSRFESDKKSPDIKRISDLSMDQQEGFAQGHTSIEFISNWQESNINDDSHRIMGISEPWDLRQQLKQQFELADEIAHM
ncbi:hypothetical protein V8B55DRAFT_1503343 [Mucor lusitanicus]|uniref:Uncharacterized protein n=2 Tax=Mucor circinelloides f. lusitanicus TaxID=29924 RepID=A0A168QAL5_MUCCL|nr:hypothetical protein MUCCIDRAFT_105931 [Mucor lusitanicus CBS 277.49]